VAGLRGESRGFVHTVIITDRHTTPLFAGYRRLFAPFLTGRGGSICQCSWHEAGGSIEQAVPELYPSIKGHPEWRVIIVTQSLQADPPAFDARNPFDFSVNADRELRVQENPVPLIRLTHMLAGFPPLGVKDYEMGYTWFNPESGEYEVCYHEGTENPVLKREIDALGEEGKAEFIQKHGGNVKQSFMEVQYSDAEKAEHKRLTQKYTLKENRPAEILILTTRESLEHDDFETTREEVRHAWKNRHEGQSADFWQRSDYPNACRFLCYDLINPENTEYPREIWKFWLLVLSLAVNQIPGQALQAYQLYKADIGLNSGVLGDVLERQREVLRSARSVMIERLHFAPKPAEDKRRELVPEQNISVKYEHIDEDEARVDSSRIGLASDCPVSEKRFWREHILKARKTIEYVLSTPREIVAAKAIETRETIDGFYGREQALDRFQLDRIRKRIDELKPRVMDAKVYGLLDAGTYSGDVEKEDEAIRRHLGCRLSKRHVILVSISALLAYLCGYIPYLVNSARISRPVLGAAFGLAAIALTLLGAGGMFILWLMRRRLVKRFDGYNKMVRAMFDRVNKGAQIYSDYFSDVCTYMYAHSLLSGVTLKKSNDYSSEKMHAAHLAALEREIEANSLLCSLCGIPAEPASLGGAYVEFDVMEPPGSSRLYELLPDGETRALRLGKSGEMLDAPYGFITELKLDREDLYESKGA